MKVARIAALALLVGGLSAGLAWAGQDKTPEKKPPTTQKAADNKFCAIEPEHPVDPNCPTYAYKDKNVGFCCEDCIETFKKDPEKYFKKMK